VTPTSDPTLGVILTEVREMRAELQAADEELRARLSSIDQKQAVANGRTTKLEVRMEAHEAAQRERFALKREVFLFLGAFLCGALPTVIVVLFSR
jgi:hypothetical protein